MTRESAPTLLVVDDERLFRDSVRDQFAAAGFEVLGAGTGAQALELCARHRIDVVALDQKLPDVEGHRLCAPLLEAHPAAKLIFITAHPSFDNAMKAIRAGAHDYLSKPFELGQLELAVSRCLGLQRLERAERQQEFRRAAERRSSVLVGAGAGLTEVRALVQRAAACDVPVLVTGETGSGKSLVARAIHHASARRGGELVVVNCAALPESLIEAELFGHERGAFTGASEAREGLFELAHGGSLFLDEIGEMPAALQSRLLNVIEDHTIRRLGGKLTRQVDVRVVAATNRDLEALVRAGSFREDLFYRLDVLRIRVPPLRERPGDLPALCACFLERMATRGQRLSLAPGELPRLQAYRWPGNARELANLLERAAILQGAELRPSLLLGSGLGVPAQVSSASPAADGSLSLETVERAHIERVLATHNGNLSRTAGALGISLSTLKRRIRQRSTGGAAPR